MENQGLGSWIYRRRIKSRDKVALIFREEQLTYGELNERVNRLANAFLAHGISRGDRIAYLGENHPSFVEVFFAATQIGALFVPLNTRLAAPELHYALEDSGSRVLVHSEELAEVAEKAAIGIDKLRLVIVGDAKKPGDASTLEVLISEGSDEFNDIELSLEEPAMILYTSGTTGHPKGALLSHNNFTWNSYNAIVEYDFASRSVALMIGPMFHVAALGMGVFPTLLCGGTLVLETNFVPERVLEIIPRHKVSIISGVPTTFQMLAEHPNFAATDLSSLETMTCGGSAIPMRIIDAYEEKGLAFMMGYGMTETSPGASCVPEAWSREKAGSAGLPLFFTDVRIMLEDGSPAPVGEIGEIQIRGRNVITEYWNKPEATADAFADGNWFKSGDMGYFDADGFLFIADRLKDMIISGGENIYPAEIEQIIVELEHITSVAMIGVPDETWGEVPWVLVTVAAGKSTSLEEVRAHLENRVARYKMPKNLIIVDEFPRTGSGKIRKADLRKQYAPPTNEPAS